ncbi:hypothetical protein UA08_08854 [Talaromyces atroroseus]|uniref:FFD box profile domain-containing protein n=1 Tax=Talaromyces atroroseus TaxID=1441469 RepID=A0A225AFQ8_TALAT|nr:hypothetical protein UA08_08854 [Talaromyces atroroseus]OKL55798.1 hypothetical protein UA08_08854 [Talaromyces atroroseus]
MDMNHLIGQRFNLISKSDIRYGRHQPLLRADDGFNKLHSYVGTLHEINPEASTIALENVVSHGTEGRRGNPSEELPASTTIYEYIVFRGSDVKDISIAEEKKEPEIKPTQVPDDPAILGSMSRPGPPATQPPQPQQQQPPPPGPQGGRPGPPPGYPQQPPFQGYGYPPYGQQRFGPPGYGPPGPGFPPYGAPPGWFPPPGHGFPPGAPGQFPPHQGPIGPPGQQRPGGPPGPPGPPVAPGKPASELPTSDKTAPQPTVASAAPAPGIAQDGPTPPVESKPSVSEATRGTVAPQGPVAATAPAPQTPSKLPPGGPKNDRFIPAIPIANAAVKPTVPLTTAQQGAVAASQNTAQAAITEATRAATAAVAAAMAKLPQPNAQKKAQNDAGVEDLTKKFNDIKPYDNNRVNRGVHHGPRGGRGQRGAPHVTGKKLELPDTDFDFESSNAKFNKQDLVKEAIATGSPIVEEEKEINGGEEDVPTSPSAAPSAYNKASSFFDNISSEIRDREEGASRGRERRGEEEKKNIETFGQGSVDGYRGGYRGRGRGRGYGGQRGRGGYGRGYGNNRGRGNFRGRSASQSTGVPTQT